MSSSSEDSKFKPQQKDNLESKVLARTRELTEANIFLDSLLENIPNMIFVKDAETLKFVSFNRAGEELVGISRQELIGKSDYDLFPEEQAREFCEKDRAVLSGHQVVDIPEELISTRTNGTRSIHTKKLPLYDSHGNPKYLLGISEDITERKKLETERLELIQANIAKREAEKSAEGFNFLAKASAVLGSSLDFETILDNLAKLSVPAFADWCSVQLIQPDRTLKQVAVAHENPEKIKWARELYEKFPVELNSNSLIAKTVRSGEASLIASMDHETLKVGARDSEHLKNVVEMQIKSFIAAPIRSRGKVLGAICFMTTEDSHRIYGESDLRIAEDLSERAGLALENSKLYREAQSLNRVKDEFLATLSHELRSPLNVIQGHAEILKSDYVNMKTEEILSSIEAIERNAKAQTGLIGDLLDVSSIISGKISYAPVEINSTEILTNIIKSQKPTADAKSVNINLSLIHPPQKAFADPTRIHQIIWNLVSNAIKFTPRGGHVDVKVTGRQDDWTIEVSDSGQGIDPEFLPYVFDRFRQEDASSTRRYGGLGLGLSIVRHLVELHGGSVEAKSDGKGRGAKFFVTLPLVGLKSEAPAEDKKVLSRHVDLPSLRKVHLQKKKILLIDDSSDNRVLVRRMLTQAGAEIVEAESAAEARQKLQGFEPDVIVCDIGMPEENGFEFIRKLRSSKNKLVSEVPALALTAYVRQEEMDAALSAGFQAHVAKPVSSRLLLEGIDRILKN